jgi:hypothetical protein
MVVEPLVLMFNCDIVPEEFVKSASEVNVKVGSVAVQENVIVVKFVKLLSTGEFNVTEPANTNGINSNRIINPFFILRFTKSWFK